jgi:hypothetical protein
MPTIDWVFLCDYAFVDAAGKASIIGIFQNIFASTLPTNHPQLYIALGMKMGPGDNFELSSILSSPSGREIAKINPQKIVIPTNAPGGGIGVVCFGYYGVQFSETGEHHIEIFIDNNSIHSIPLNVAINKPK